MPKTLKWTLVLFPLVLTLLLLYLLPLPDSKAITGAIIMITLAGYGFSGWLLVLSQNNLRQKQQMIEWMATAIPGGTYIVDSSYKYAFVSVNTERFRPLFPEPSTLVGKDYREHMLSIGVKLEESDIIQALETGKTTTGVKMNYGPYILSYDTVPLRHPITGKVTAAATYWRDITEEEQATFRLRELKKQYRTLSQQLQTLIDTLPLSVLYMDKDTNITAINNAFVSYYPEYTKDELLRMTCRELAKRRGVLYDTMNIAKALNGETILAEYSVYRENSFLSYAFPIYSAETGEITGAAALYQDITEIEGLRSELSRMESLGLVGQMAASITHEIRNPMAVIQGFVQLLQKKNPGVFMNYYDIILEELNRANDIINDFLALAQNRVVEMKDAHLNETIRTLEPMIQADANLRGITLQVELQEGLPAILMNDKEMKQLLLNLSRNSLEAMSSDGLLAILTSRQESNVQLVITDTGPGIPVEQRDKIFQPFYTTKERGTGLGLPVCYSIVKKHNGSMEIHSAMGQGTVITITFPLTVSV